VINLESARQKLQERRKTLAVRTDRIQQDLRKLPDSDSQERVTELENDEVLERLDDAERGELARLDHALERLNADSYEDCERCGEKINPGRREAVLDTSFCIQCA
jgi:DnaK suppressor protein